MSESRSHPERVWTTLVTVAPLDGSTIPVTLPVTIDTSYDLCLIVQDRSHGRTAGHHSLVHQTSPPGRIECPSKLPAADTVHVPQGLFFHERQEPLSPVTNCPLRDIAPPVPVTGPIDLNSLPVPLGSTEQCQAPSTLDVEPPQTLTSAPGPELAPAPNLNKDTPTGDPPTGMELTTAHGQSQATTASAPDSISGLTPESVPPSTPGTGVARPWRNKKKKKKKKGRSKLTN
ncbi:nematocyst expressed protein 3-like [Macrobrachium nipponense]|uniref:nematocyst expressed protein 3-like n=1 Tax=Macrobrachium nipponense TaxID=159736 RepID=UPI0030C8C167